MSTLISLFGVFRTVPNWSVWLTEDLYYIFEGKYDDIFFPKVTQGRRMLNGVHGRLYIAQRIQGRIFGEGWKGEGGIKIFIRQHTDCLTLPCTISPLARQAGISHQEFLGFFWV